MPRYPAHELLEPAEREVDPFVVSDGLTVRGPSNLEEIALTLSDGAR